MRAARGVLATWSVLAGPVLAGPVLAARTVLAPVGRVRRARRCLGAVTCAHALAEPDSGGPQHAAQLADAGQVAALTGAEREVLVVTRQAARLRPAARTREPVVRIRPGGSLLRVSTRCTHPFGQFGKLIPATLADGGKRHRVPGQPQRNLIRPPG